MFIKFAPIASLIFALSLVTQQGSVFLQSRAAKSVGKEIRTLPGRTVSLVAGSAKDLDVPSFGYFGEALCDSAGDLFFHVDSGSIDEVSILRLSASGQKGSITSIPPDLVPKYVMSAFTVSPSGQLYVLAQSKEDHSYEVIGFNERGIMGSRTRLDAPDNLTADEFAVFDDGVVLLKGYYNGHAIKENQGKNYAALFEPSGKLRRKVGEVGGLTDLAPEANKITDGMVVLGDDGLAYAPVRNEILAVTETAEIAKRIRFDLPASGAVLTRLQVSGGAIAIIFSRPEKNHRVTRSYLLIRPNGTRTLFEAPQEMGDNVCFSAAEGFTFLKVDPKKHTISLITAQAR